MSKLKPSIEQMLTIGIDCGLTTLAECYAHILLHYDCFFLLEPRGELLFALDAEIADCRLSTRIDDHSVFIDIDAVLALQQYENYITPIVGSKWMHTKGDIYKVCGIANTETDYAKRNEYPVSISYYNVATNKVYQKYLNKWHSSMTPVIECNTCMRYWNNFKIYTQSMY